MRAVGKSFIGGVGVGVDVDSAPPRAMVADRTKGRKRMSSRFAVRRAAVRCGAVRCNAVRCGAVWWNLASERVIDNTSLRSVLYYKDLMGRKVETSFRTGSNCSLFSLQSCDAPVAVGRAIGSRKDALGNNVHSSD